MDESLVGSPGFKPVREALTLSWVGSIPTRLRHLPPMGELATGLSAGDVLAVRPPQSVSRYQHSALPRVRDVSTRPYRSRSRHKPSFSCTVRSEKLNSTASSVVSWR